MPLAVALALGAAACIALASALEHHAATGVHASLGGPRLVLRLARDRRWVLGFTISVIGLGLHGAALHSGPLSIVQPLLVTSLVFALPIRALLDHARPIARDVAAATVVVAALAGFLLAARPGAGQPGPDGVAFGWTVGCGAACVLACSLIASRAGPGRSAGFALGLATGVLYGLTGGAMKATVHQASDGIVSLVTSWPLWTLIIVGVWALVVNQRAFTQAPLRLSLPVMTVANPIIAVVFGAVVYGETPDDEPLAIVLQVIALVALTAGVTALAAPRSATSR